MRPTVAVHSGRPHARPSRGTADANDSWRTATQMTQRDGNPWHGVARVDSTGSTIIAAYLLL